MQHVMDDIYWQSATYKDNHDDWDKVIFQWSRSHTDTNGNEKADKLAKVGMEATSVVHKNDLWRYYSKKAANTELYHYYRDQMVLQMQRCSARSRFSELYSKYEITWPSIFKQELKYLCRKDLKLLLSLRSDHCDLPVMFSRCVPFVDALMIWHINSLNVWILHCVHPEAS